ncbi:hypothetical protein K6V71_12860 [Cupriavidus gilardii]|uniref:hypothetical protein n=1 Tax=Cupriavidus gilardii TaxID=82541 RepID=UPI0021DA8819
MLRIFAPSRPAADPAAHPAAAPAVHPAASLEAGLPNHTEAQPQPPQDIRPAGVGAGAGVTVVAAHRAEPAPSADAVRNQPAPRVVDLLDSAWQKLTSAVHSLPDTSRKDEILSTATRCGKKIAKAQSAAARIEAWDLQQGHDVRISPQELLRLRADIKQCAQSVGEALADLDQLATSVRDYPDNEAPGTRAIVLMGIAGIVSALAMLVVTVACPPLGLALLGALAAGGAAGGGYLIHKLCQAASAHEGFERANGDVSGALRQSLEQARALEARFNDELAPALMRNATLRTTKDLQEFLERQMSLNRFAGDVTQRRAEWQRDITTQLHADLPRDQSELVYPCEIADERLIPPGFRDGLAALPAEQQQREIDKRLPGAIDIAINKIRAAADGNDDTFDALLYLITQRPRNAVENAAMTVLARAIGLSEAFSTAAGQKINLVQIACDESGRAIGGTITYKLYQPAPELGLNALYIMPLGAGEIMLAPEDAGLQAVATFALEGRNIKVTSLTFNATLSILAACAEMFAPEVDRLAQSGNPQDFVFDEKPAGSNVPVPGDPPAGRG